MFSRRLLLQNTATLSVINRGLLKPHINTTRSFQRSAIRQITENKEVSGVQGIIEADNATFTKSLYHKTQMGLMWLTPIAVILSPSPLSMPLDFALGILIPIHSHIGMNNVISDYVPKHTQPLARLGWLGATLVMAIGFLRVNIEGDGIIETVKTIWREPPQNNHESS